MAKEAYEQIIQLYLHVLSARKLLSHWQQLPKTKVFKPSSIYKQSAYLLSSLFAQLINVYSVALQLEVLKNFNEFIACDGGV